MKKLLIITLGVALYLYYLGTVIDSYEKDTYTLTISHALPPNTNDKEFPIVCYDNLGQRVVRSVKSDLYFEVATKTNRQNIINTVKYEGSLHFWYGLCAVTWIVELFLLAAVLIEWLKK